MDQVLKVTFTIVIAFMVTVFATLLYRHGVAMYGVGIVAAFIILLAVYSVCTREPVDLDATANIKLINRARSRCGDSSEKNAALDTLLNTQPSGKRVQEFISNLNPTHRANARTAS